LCALGPAAQRHNKDFQHHHHRALADPPTPQPPPATLSPTHPHPTCLLAPYLHRCSFSHHADRTQSTYEGTQSTYTYLKKIADSPLPQPPPAALPPLHPRPTCYLAPRVHRHSLPHQVDRTQSTNEGTQDTSITASARSRDATSSRKDYYILREVIPLISKARVSRYTRCTSWLYPSVPILYPLLYH